MNETTKTIAFVATALVIGVMAFFVSRRPDEKVQVNVGQDLFPDFKDPLDARQMAITTYSEKSGDVDNFEVKQVDGVWSLPSRYNYPADGTQHMVKAATSVIGLKVLGVAGTTAAEHQTFSVLDPPDPKKSKSGLEGIGKLVTIQDAKGKNLVRLIIGKKDEKRTGGPNGSPTIRYVRQPGSDVVYRVALNGDEFSSNFKDWIEPDLLQINPPEAKDNPPDVKQLQIQNYTLQIAPDETDYNIAHKMDAALAFDSKDFKWNLVYLINYVKGQPEREELAKDEEVDTLRLTTLKNTLRDLKIVDVAPKPKGVSENLIVKDRLAFDDKSLKSLADCGFYFVRVGRDRVDLKSNQGEVRVAMQDGVQYSLRFGNTLKSADSDAVDAKQADDKKDDDKKDTDKKDTDKMEADKPNADKHDEDKPNSPPKRRYLLVMAEFRPDLIPKPDLEPLPDEAPADNKPEESKKPDAGQPSDEAAPNPADAKTPNEKAPDAKKPDVKKSEGAPGEKGDAPPAGTASSAKVAADKKTAGTSAAKDTNAQGTNEKSADATKASDKTNVKPDSSKDDAAPSTGTPFDKPKDSAKPDAENSTDPKSDPEKKAEAEKKAAERARDAAEAERARIVKSNHDKQTAYEKQIEKGKKRVAELNSRFADWYYVVSDADYHKIQLDRDELIKKKEIPNPNHPGLNPDGSPSGLPNLPPGLKLPPGFKLPPPDDNPPAKESPTKDPAPAKGATSDKPPVDKTPTPDKTPGPDKNPAPKKDPAGDKAKPADKTKPADTTKPKATK